MNYPIAGTCTCPQASLLFIRELISNSAKFEYSGHKGTHWHKITGRLCPHDVHSQNIHSQSVYARNVIDIVSPKLPYSVTVAICYNCLALMCGVRQLGNIPASPCCHGSINQHSLTHTYHRLQSNYVYLCYGDVQPLYVIAIPVSVCNGRNMIGGAGVKGARGCEAADYPCEASACEAPPGNMTYKG